MPLTTTGIHPHPNPLPPRERGQDTDQRPDPVDSASTAQPRRKTGTSGAGDPTGGWAELHCHSNYSFQEGASEAWDLLLTAKQLGIYALAITDHDNVSGVMEFAQAAKELGIKPIIGIELTLARGLG